MDKKLALLDKKIALEIEEKRYRRCYFIKKYDISGSSAR